MKNLKVRIALVAATGVIGAVTVGGVLAAQADSPQGGSNPDHTSQSDGETNDDATDTGPDADPNEAGHQDADDQNEGEEGVETNDDATDTGPDANPDEPGHQDADDSVTGDN
jgi:hypothetical protein